VGSLDTTCFGYPTLVVLTGRSLLTNFHLLANETSVVVIRDDLPVALAEAGALLTDLFADRVFDRSLLSLGPVRAGLLAGVDTGSAMLVESSVEDLLAPLVVLSLIA
jgi:hypothetical protein